MNFIRKEIEKAREEYKYIKENKTAIELMYITRAIRKGSASKC